MSYLPCRNQNCPSYGKPHPNCKCHGAHAEGGMVEPFCATTRPHGRGCEYFAEGGEVPTDDLPQVASAGEVPADDLPAAEPVAEVEVPAEDLPEEPGVVAETEVPEDDLPDEMKPPAEPGMVDSFLADRMKGTAWDPAQPTSGNAITPESTAAMNREYEDAFGVGSLVTGSGAVGAASKAATAAAEWAGLSKVGAGFLKGAITNGLITGTDEASKMLLGDDPEQPVATILASAGLGGVFGGAGAKIASTASEKLTKLTEGKFGDRLTSWLAGLGSAANPANQEMAALSKEVGAIQGFSKKDYQAGMKAFKSLLGKIAAPASVGAATSYGYHEDGLPGAIKYGTGAYAAGIGAGLLGKYAGKVATPVVLKILSSDSSLGILDALNHAEKVAKGVRQVDRAVESLFGGTAKVGAVVAGNHKKLEDWLENGGVTDEVQQSLHEAQSPEVPGFAKGGEVQPVQRQENGVATHFPEQNVIMQAAKARASNYLNTLRPSKNAPRLAFDAQPDDRKQKKTYQRALAVANSPLKILDEIKRGTVEPDDIKHLSKMFPEVVSMLQKKVTERISKSQLSEQRPSSKVRQGLSMLLGTPLSGELTPQGIQAAQAVFARAGKQSSPEGAPSKPSGTKVSALSKSDRAFLTDDQARMARQQRT